jgi:hypothetical protein
MSPELLVKLQAIYSSSSASKLDGGEWLIACPRERDHGTHWIRGYVASYMAQRTLFDPTCILTLFVLS